MAMVGTSDLHRAQAVDGPARTPVRLLALLNVFRAFEALQATGLTLWDVKDENAVLQYCRASHDRPARVRGMLIDVSDVCALAANMTLATTASVYFAQPPEYAAVHRVLRKDKRIREAYVARAGVIKQLTLACLEGDGAALGKLPAEERAFRAWYLETVCHLPTEAAASFGNLPWASWVPACAVLVKECTVAVSANELAVSSCSGTSDGDTYARSDTETDTTAAASEHTRASDGTEGCAPTPVNPRGRRGSCGARAGSACTTNNVGDQRRQKQGGNLKACQGNRAGATDNSASHRAGSVGERTTVPGRGDDQDVVMERGSTSARAPAGHTRVAKEASAGRDVHLPSQVAVATIHGWVQHGLEEPTVTDCTQIAVANFRAFLTLRGIPDADMPSEWGRINGARAVATTAAWLSSPVLCPDRAVVFNLGQMLLGAAAATSRHPRCASDSSLRHACEDATALATRMLHPKPQNRPRLGHCLAELHSVLRHWSRTVDAFPAPRSGAYHGD
jgi:hypothetical protein